METETILAKDITVAGDKSALDAACRKLLANKSILAWILKECVPEYKDCSVNDIANKYIEGNPDIAAIGVHPETTNLPVEEPSNKVISGMSNEDKSITEHAVTYDIRFRAIAPKTGGMIQLFINIEAQNKYNPGYPLTKRGIYYCSRMISAQYGTEFTGSGYDKIKKVYSIWICTHPTKKKANSITSYSIEEHNIVGSVKESKENYDLLNTIMICLGDNENSQNKILRLLQVLLSSEINAQSKKEILTEDYKINMTQQLDEEVESMCNISDGIVADAEERGMAKGKKEEKFATAKRLLDIGVLSIEQIAAGTGLPVKEIEALASA